MKNLEKLLSGADLRSTGQCESVVAQIKNENHFDQLFAFLFHPDRVIVMHASDAIEKITRLKPQYLQKHKADLLKLFYRAKNKELKWHLAVLIPRLKLSVSIFQKVWNELMTWCHDRSNSKLVRVGAVQGLFEMARNNKRLLADFFRLAEELEKEKVPSINARIRNIRHEIKC